jgi:hypothetical protein
MKPDEEEGTTCTPLLEQQGRAQAGYSEGAGLMVVG